jgi:mannose-1-phosphate guanylyltransferase
MGAQMRSRGYTWSLVLAGGEGSRLRSLTTDGAGPSVPKQFCSLFGATTLLEDALNRGRAVADGGRVCVARPLLTVQCGVGARGARI